MTSTSTATPPARTVTVPPWEARNQMLRGIRTVFAGPGILALIGLGGGGLLKILGGMSGDTLAPFAWRLIKSLWLLGASIALIRIWMEAVEQRNRADFLERYHREQEERMAEALAQGKNCVVTNRTGERIWFGKIG